MSEVFSSETGLSLSVYRVVAGQEFQFHNKKDIQLQSRVRKYKKYELIRDEGGHSGSFSCRLISYRIINYSSKVRIEKVSKQNVSIDVI